jgi:hypothetical protein
MFVDHMQVIRNGKFDTTGEAEYEKDEINEQVYENKNNNNKPTKVIIPSKYDF